MSINLLIKYYNHSEAKNHFPVLHLPSPPLSVPQLEGGLPDFIPKTHVMLLAEAAHDAIVRRLTLTT